MRRTTQRDVDTKFRECFGLGVRPLTAGQAEMLTSRVREIEKLDDVSTLFDGILK